MWPFDWFRRRWQRSQRQIDIDILWPSIRVAASDNLVHAHAAFRLHVRQDPAWSELSDEERDRIISELH